jgi:hypothetical protein
MKNFKIILGVLMLLFFVACNEDDATFGEVVTPTNLQVNVDVAQDQSGNVVVFPSADGVVNFHVYFVQGAEPVVINNGDEALFRYTQSGTYEQVITVIAYGTGGASSSETVVINLDVQLVIDPIVLQDIAGGINESKRWVWDQTNAGHFGVGDPAELFPNFFSAGPSSLDPCLYDDVLVFSHDGNNNYSFLLETGDATFVNWAEVKRFFPDASPQEFVDECRDISDQIETDTDFVIISNADSTLSLEVSGSVMSYWSGAMIYEITELTANKLTVRGIQEPFAPTGAALAWYHTFVPEGETIFCPGGGTGNTGSGTNTTLVWEENFNDDGAPCGTTWNFELGNGGNGWGNGEQQFYTDSPTNIVVEGGVLKITARAEEFNGSEYTSGRITTKDKFEFTYGKVEARAKLPTGGGTWPAIWMLGADFEVNPWPAAGEMDIMEHVGNDQDRIFSTVHYPGNSGGGGVGNSTVVVGASEDFHIYSIEWTPEQIICSVDGNPHFLFNNDSSLPFNKDFFLILNVAMGGNFGGDIDPNFTESTMEIDYIKVFQ